MSIFPEYDKPLFNSSFGIDDHNLSNNNIHEINLKYHPLHGVFDPSTDLVYILSNSKIENGTNRVLVVIDSLENKIIKEIPINYSAYEDLAIDRDKHRIFGIGAGIISILDVTGNSHIKHIKLADTFSEYIGPQGKNSIAVNPVTSKVYALRGVYDNTVYVYDSMRDSIIKNITVNELPNDIAVNEKTNMIYVTHPEGLSIIDGKTNSLVKNITFLNPTSVIADSSTNKTFVAIGHGNRIAVIDGNNNEVQTTISIDNSYNGDSELSFDSYSNIIYLRNADSNTIFAIYGLVNGTLDIQNFEPDIRFGSPSNSEIIPTKNKLYLINGLRNSIFIINDLDNISSLKTNDRINEISVDELYRPGIKVGKDPFDIDINPLTNRIYVTNLGSNSVSVIDGSSARVIDSITQQYPKGIAVDYIQNEIYVANSMNKSISVIDGSTNNITSYIPLEDNPEFIAISCCKTEPEKDGVNPVTLYVTYERSNNFTVISIYEDGISKVNINSDPSQFSQVQSIAVNRYNDMVFANKGAFVDIYEDGSSWDEPNRVNKIKSLSALAVDQRINILYGIGFSSDILYIIDPYAPDKPIENVSLGLGHNGEASYAISNNKHYSNIAGPRDLAINPVTGLVYVANYVSGSVSVVDSKTHNLTRNITVGVSPNAIGVNPITNLVYVVNPSSDTVSIVDGSTNELVSRVIFKVNPSSDAGYIKCGIEQLSLNVSHYISYGSKCIAEANEGFGFSSWIEELNDNSTKTVLSSKIKQPFFYPVLSFLGLTKTDNSSTLKINGPGTFIANFRELPPVISPDLWIPLYGIIISTIVGLSIPSIISWAKSKKDVRKLDHYHEKIKMLYNDGKLDEKDISDLDGLKRDMTDAYSKGKLNEKHYENLKTEISILYDKIFRKSIDSSKQVTDGDLSKQLSKLSKIKEDIENAHSEGKITELQFGLLNKKIQEITDDDNKK